MLGDVLETSRGASVGPVGGSGGQLPAGLAASPLPTGTLGADGTWTAANAALTAALGDPPAPAGDLLAAAGVDLGTVLDTGAPATVPVVLPGGWFADVIVTPEGDGGPWLVQILERSETQALADRLADAAEATTRFVSRVSHDLKNPIGTAQGYAELLLEDPSVAEEARAFADRILSSIGRANAILVEIVADARDASRVRPPDEVDVTAVLAEVLAGLRELVDERGAIVTATTPLPLIRSDARTIHRALEALVHNAVEHHPAGARVEVWSRVTATGWELVVDDDGPGILPDERRAALTGGIGLPMTRSALARYGAELELDDADLGGLRARVHIPQRRSRDPEIPLGATGA